MPATATAANPTTAPMGFILIPLRIFFDATLSPWAKFTYGILRYHDRGNGCFAARETLSSELNTSTYHIRMGIRQLLERGEITVKERGMGRTDMIRLTDQSLGIPTPPSVDSTPPEFELPPEPELPEAPQLPDQPGELERVETAVESPVGFIVDPPIERVETAVESPVERVETAVESPVERVETAVESPVEAVVESSVERVEAVVESPVEIIVAPPVERVEAVVESPVEAAVESPVEAVVESSVEPVEPVGIAVEEPVEREKSPAEAELQPVELRVQNFETPGSKILNYKYRVLEEDNKKYTHTSTKPGNMGPPNRCGAEKQCDDEKELISLFYEKKERRQPSYDEIRNWRRIARTLLDKFTIDELKPAIEDSIRQGARLLIFMTFTAPPFCNKKRQQREKQAKKAQKIAEAQREAQEGLKKWENLRKQGADYDDQTEHLLQRLQKEVSPQNFNCWFRESFIIASDEKALTLVIAISPDLIDWIADRYREVIQEVTGKPHIKFMAG